MSSTIGKFVMDGLKDFNHRFCRFFGISLTDFKEAKDFEQLVDIDNLNN